MNVVLVGESNVRAMPAFVWSPIEGVEGGRLVWSSVLMVVEGNWLEWPSD